MLHSVLPSRAPTKPQHVTEAEAAFTPAELAALHQEHCLHTELDRFSQALTSESFLVRGGGTNTQCVAAAACAVTMAAADHVSHDCRASFPLFLLSGRSGQDWQAPHLRSPRAFVQPCGGTQALMQRLASSRSTEL